MSRYLTLLLLLAGGSAHAQAEVEASEPPPDPSDQIIGASLGVAIGGRVTPGGLRITGHYHYQLNSTDWFDGRASFLFGTGGAECFRDRMDLTICDHGLADGKAVQLSANVRRYFREGQYKPYGRLGLGVAIVRFGDDDVTGVAFPLHAGVGLRVMLTTLLALTAEAELEVGVGRFNSRLGSEPYVGTSIAAGAEFRL